MAPLDTSAISQIVDQVIKSNPRLAPFQATGKRPDRGVVKGPSRSNTEIVKIRRAKAIELKKQADRRAFLISASRQLNDKLKNLTEKIADAIKKQGIDVNKNLKAEHDRCLGFLSQLDRLTSEISSSDNLDELESKIEQIVSGVESLEKENEATVLISAKGSDIKEISYQKQKNNPLLSMPEVFKPTVGNRVADDTKKGQTQQTLFYGNNQHDNQEVNGFVDSYSDYLDRQKTQDEEDFYSSIVPETSQKSDEEEKREEEMNTFVSAVTDNLDQHKLNEQKERERLVLQRKLEERIKEQIKLDQDAANRVQKNWSDDSRYWRNKLKQQKLDSTDKNHDESVLKNAKPWYEGVTDWANRLLDIKQTEKGKRKKSKLAMVASVMKKQRDEAYERARQETKDELKRRGEKFLATIKYARENPPKPEELDYRTKVRNYKADKMSDKQRRYLMRGGSRDNGSSVTLAAEDLEDRASALKISQFPGSFSLQKNTDSKFDSAEIAKRVEEALKNIHAPQSVEEAFRSAEVSKDNVDSAIARVKVRVKNDKWSEIAHRVISNEELLNKLVKIINS
jgi:hypothetical protein